MSPATMLDPSAWLSKPFSASSALILANKKPGNFHKYHKLARHCSKRVVLDGAANIYAQDMIEEQFSIDLAIGDGDSVTKENLALLKSKGVEFIYDKNPDATDMMKGIGYCKDHWPEITTLYIYNGYGGRVDHSWHSIYCLGYAERLGLQAFLVSDENVTMRCSPGTTEIATPLDLFGETCGVAPLQGSSIITLQGFEWDVEGFETSFDTQLSTSNHLVADTVTVTTDKPLAFTMEIRQ